MVFSGQHAAISSSSATKGFSSSELSSSKCSFRSALPFVQGWSAFRQWISSSWLPSIALARPHITKDSRIMSSVKLPHAVNTQFTIHESFPALELDVTHDVQVKRPAIIFHSLWNFLTLKIYEFHSYFTIDCCFHLSPWGLIQHCFIFNLLSDFD